MTQSLKTLACNVNCRACRTALLARLEHKPPPQNVKEYIQGLTDAGANVVRAVNEATSEAAGIPANVFAAVEILAAMLPK